MVHLIRKMRRVNGVKLVNESPMKERVALVLLVSWVAGHWEAARGDGVLGSPSLPAASCDTD